MNYEKDTGYQLFIIIIVSAFYYYYRYLQLHSVLRIISRIVRSGSTILLQVTISNLPSMWMSW